MDNLFQFFFTSPEIEEWVSDAQLRDKYDITFAENGWYQLNDDQDFALVIESFTHFIYCVMPTTFKLLCESAFKIDSLSK